MAASHASRLGWFPVQGAGERFSNDASNRDSLGDYPQ